MTGIRPDRQAAHDAAVARGDAGYLDPDSGLFVMTADYLRAKGPCCSSGCRHCPYRKPAAEATATPAAGSAGEDSTTTRIVSLLPATTDILWFLGLGDHVVGVTYECHVPAGEDLPPKVTDTILPVDASPAEIDIIISDAIAAGRQLYELDNELLASLDPGLIVTQDLCRVCALPAGEVEAAIESLGGAAEVFQYDPMTLDQVLDGIEELGRLADAGPDALAKVDRLRERVQASRDAAPTQDRPRVLLLEWPDPPYGPGHWIPDQIEAAGGEAVLANPGGRSSAMSWDDVAASNADVLIVAPCGFDEAQAAEQLAVVVARPELASLPAVVNGRTYAIDADQFIVRPGPTLVDGIAELANLIHLESEIA